jgi:hypothetical protein
LLIKPLKLRRKSRPNLYPTQPTMVCWAWLSAVSTQVRLQVRYQLPNKLIELTVKPVKQKTFFDMAKPSLSSPVFTADLKYHAPGM